MNNILQSNKSMEWNEYINSMQENKSDFKKITDNVLENKNLNKLILNLSKKLENSEILILTEDFCPDSMFNIPIFIAISELINNVKLKIFRRSENEKLTDYFLSKNLDRIPAVLILISGDIKYKWQEKPQKAYKIQTNIIEQINKLDNLSKIEMKNHYFELSENEYRKKLWVETINEIQNLKEL
tara:strand:+ start:4026 stop:4577 length:552 start_codon:yes stop_codon:yes gene_type:complete